MHEIEKLGFFYLGKTVDPEKKKSKDNLVFYEANDLTTHAMCVGMTGSGKTGLGIVILEEAAIDGIPALILDPKGDMPNLMLAFPNLKGSDFLPWIDETEAKRKKETPKAFADETAKIWKEGLADWEEDGKRIKRYKDSVQTEVYTPANHSGIPLSILNSFSAPSEDFILDRTAFRDRVMTTTSSLLGLLGIEADPIKSREHILISAIIDSVWRQHQSLDLSDLIQLIIKPPFDKIGALPTDTFFPAKERLSLAMNLNNLLASPSFQAWMEGEPLDIQDLLYTKEGKPKHSIISIAHLSDSERMFFVTLFLNEVLTWMRSQSGTTSLRALLYMDEIFGFFPPTAAPPSKLPMLTLLKQARAFGLGIILATQNPVDLDYKGLSNCGTWFIGKLQTERDKARLLEGLKSASSETGIDKVKKMLLKCGKRIFIMRNVHQPEPILFETRWTLSYLRGPLTLPQIKSLTYTGNATDQASSKETEPLEIRKPKPPLSTGMEEYYYNATGKMENLVYTPYVLGSGQLHYVSGKNNIDAWQDIHLLAPVSDNGKKVFWEKGEEISDIKEHLKRDFPVQSSFEDLPSGLMDEKNHVVINKSLAVYLYQNQHYEIYQFPNLKMVSKNGEDQGDFIARLNQVLREKRDEEVKKLREKYESKINVLQDKIRRMQDRNERQKDQVSQSKFETYVSIGATILGSILGKKPISATTINKAGSTMRRAGKIDKAEQEAAQSKDSLESYQNQLKDLEREVQDQVSIIQNNLDPSVVKIDTITLKPRKTDITVDPLSIVWVAR